MTMAQDEIVKKLVSSGATAIFAYKNRVDSFNVDLIGDIAKPLSLGNIISDHIEWFFENDVLALALKLPTEADPLYRMQVMGIDFGHNCHAAKIGDVIADMMHMIGGTEPPPNELGELK